MGQLAGQGLMLAENEELWQQDKMTWQNDVPEGSNDMEPDRDPVQPVDPDRNKEDLSGLPLGAGREEGDLDNVPGTGGELQQMPAEQEQRTPLIQKTEFRIFMAVLATFMLLASFGCLEKWDENRRRELFVRADRRERIFLLYRNFRRVFQLAGIRRELNVDGEEFRHILQHSFRVSDTEYEAFCRILEKNSFAREEPSEEEFGEVRALYDRLAEEAYARAVFYNKPLIRRCRSCV